MNAERWARIKTLFTAALDLPATERGALLAREGADDAALIAEVESLLAAHEQPGEFLDSVPEAMRAEALATSDDTSRVGERIGAYRITGLLGTGGMGDVYRAIRDDDQYHAEVAIKLMRADVRHPHAERRFRNERQILAGLDHRNIARLLDGGATTNGLPYVVMELVSGEPIDRYCDAHTLPIRERVQLFLQVCAAVSYAHQQLVVHRDLKPNNILVTADGSVKLLDFGIAKLLESDAATADGGADATMTQLRAMTLEYASPEQVSGGTVTTVSDVYSLGVVFYRLLTGQSPYRAGGNDAQRMAEILGDTMPTRPSLVQTNAHRKIDADLDNILLMALRKEPQKRYGSVEQLANDLRNYLNGLPVLARGDAWRYRVGKFVRRRRMEIAAAALIMVSLIGGLGLALREARVADQQRRIAQRHFDSVRKLANSLLFDFHDEIAKLPGATRAREKLVTTSLEYLDALYQESGNDRALQEELATAYRKVGDLQASDLEANKGATEAALTSFARAIALLEAVLEATPANHRAVVSLAKTYMLQSRVLYLTGGAKAGREPIEKALALLESTKDGYTDDFERMKLLADALFTRAELLAGEDQNSEAIALLDRVISIAVEYLRAHPDEKRANVVLADAYNNAAIFDDPRLSPVGAARRSISLIRKSLAIEEKLLALEPDDVARQVSIGQSYYNLGVSQYETDEFVAAIESYRRASPGIAKAAADVDDAHGQLMQALLDTGLGEALVKTGNTKDAEPLFARAEANIQAIATKSGDTFRLQYSIAQIEIRRGEMYVLLATDPRASSAAAREYWRKARDSLRHGVTLLEGVNKMILLTGTNKALWEGGITALAKAEAVLRAGPLRD